MRVAIHIGSRVWGGAERAVTRLAAALQQRGHELRIFCNDADHAARCAELGLAAEVAPLHGDIGLSSALRLARRLRAHRPAVLIVATFKKLWLAGLAAGLARVPGVIVRVGLDSDVPRSWKYRFALKHLVSAVVLNSRDQAPPFLALPGWDERRVRVIYNYYEPRPAGSAARVRRELGLPDGVRVVGAVARLARQKRLERLLEAVQGMPGVHCVLAGAGPRRTELRERSRSLGIADRVHFLGQREDIPDVLALLEVFVICSDREGMSNAMLEALAAGIPVVSTAVSGAAEALEPLADGTCPGIITGAEPAAIRAAIARILDDDSLRASMSAAARHRVAERFTPAPILDQWEAVLRLVAPTRAP